MSDDAPEDFDAHVVALRRQFAERLGGRMATLAEAVAGHRAAAMALEDACKAAGADGPAPDLDAAWTALNTAAEAVRD
ncbi:MAG: hypothetical protein VW405_10025 [Rhodospirillaceae bacterium]